MMLIRNVNTLRMIVSSLECVISSIAICLSSYCCNNDVLLLNLQLLPYSNS